jgi:hypothetical protein
MSTVVLARLIQKAVTGSGRHRTLCATLRCPRSRRARATRTGNCPRRTPGPTSRATRASRTSSTGPAALCQCTRTSSARSSSAAPPVRAVCRSSGSFAHCAGSWLIFSHPGFSHSGCSFRTCNLKTPPFVLSVHYCFSSRRDGLSCIKSVFGYYYFDL